MPRCTASTSPLSRWTQMYLARRSRRSTVRPVSRSANAPAAESAGPCGAARRCTKRRPRSTGSRPRRTVSTSGSSGIAALDVLRVAPHLPTAVLSRDSARTGRAAGSAPGSPARPRHRVRLRRCRARRACGPPPAPLAHDVVRCSMRTWSTVSGRRPLGSGAVSSAPSLASQNGRRR